MNCPKCEEPMELETTTSYYKHDINIIAVLDRYWCPNCDCKCGRRAIYKFIKEDIDIDEEQRAG